MRGFVLSLNKLDSFPPLPCKQSQQHPSPFPHFHPTSPLHSYPQASSPNAGALVYELLSGKQLFDVGSNLGNYQSKLASIHLMDLSGCPPQLLGTLKAMLSTQPSARPNANAFSGAPYFQVPRSMPPICI